MKRIHIVGRKKHGKTTLIVDLVGQLRARQVRVGTIKHTAHAHELDTPGKDSYRQRLAGADPAAIVTPDLVGLYVHRRADADCYQHLAPMFSACDLVLVEGHLDCPGVKVEVWRQDAGGPCLALEQDDIAAVVTDDSVAVDVPLWPRSDVAALAGHILALAEERFGS